MEKSLHQKGIIAVVIAALLWSTGGLFIKLISLNSIQLSFFRSFFAGLVILLLFRGKALKFNGWSLMTGLFYAGVLVFFVMATKLTTAANAIFLQYTAPIYVLILEPLLLKTKFERINLITIVFCFIGMALFFVGKLSPGDIEGNTFALISGLCLTGMFLGMRKSGEDYKWSTIFWGNFFVALFCAYSLFDMPALSTNDFLMVGYLGIFQIGIAYVIFSYGINKVEAIEASLLAMIEPVLNPVWVLIGYGETPSFYAIIGGVIIVLAIALRTLMIEKRRRRKPAF
ncbi:MAG: EamA family transporter [Ignavibacteria bacterium]|nr:EamA family transporter [Ignavibacteria bacterium]